LTSTSSLIPFETRDQFRGISNIKAMEKDTKASVRCFGLAKDTRKPGEPLKMTENTTVWEIYNHKAAEVDREMIKDWNDSLNTLLIFVGRNNNS
jgi:hypothetical protein